MCRLDASVRAVAVATIHCKLWACFVGNRLLSRCWHAAPCAQRPRCAWPATRVSRCWPLRCLSARVAVAPHWLPQVPLTSDKCEPLLAEVAAKKEYFLQRCACHGLGLTVYSVLSVASACWRWLHWREARRAACLGDCTAVRCLAI